MGLRPTRGHVAFRPRCHKLPSPCPQEDEPNAMRALVERIRQEERRIAEDGGAKAVERQHEKGRLTARERVAKLCDVDDKKQPRFLELGLWAAWGMYAEW